jgi:hypothetical protein
MNSIAMLKPRKQTKLEMALVALTKGANFLRSCVGTQRIAASASNPFIFIQRPILFDLKECRSRLHIEQLRPYRLQMPLPVSATACLWVASEIIPPWFEG